MQKKINLEIIALAQTGDEAAFTKLYNAYSKHVQYLAYRILNNHHDAQDATQAVFVQVHQSIINLKCPEYFILWLNRITLGKCNSIYRKKKIAVVDMEDFSYANRLIENKRENQPEKHMKFKSDQELVDVMIMELSYEQRQVIVLFYFEELSLQEIADITKEPLGTVKSRLFLAKKKLRQHIEAYQSREKTSIDFHSIDFDTLIIASLANGFQIFSGTAKGSVVVGLLSKVKHVVATSAGKAVVVTLALSTTTVAAIGVYQGVRDDRASTIPLSQNIQNTQHDQNEQDAYFTILNWASNENIINHHDRKDIEMIQDAYNLLQNEQGVYWQELQKRGWVQAFDEFKQK